MSEVKSTIKPDVNGGQRCMTTYMELDWGAVGGTACIGAKINDDCPSNLAYAAIAGHIYLHYCEK